MVLIDVNYKVLHGIVAATCGLQTKKKFYAYKSQKLLLYAAYAVYNRAARVF